MPLRLEPITLILSYSHKWGAAIDVRSKKEKILIRPIWTLHLFYGAVILVFSNLRPSDWTPTG